MGVLVYDFSMPSPSASYSSSLVGMATDRDLEYDLECDLECDLEELELPPRLETPNSTWLLLPVKKLSNKILEVVLARVLALLALLILLFVVMKLRSDFVGEVAPDAGGVVVARVSSAVGRMFLPNSDLMRLPYFVVCSLRSKSKSSMVCEE